MTNHTTILEEAFNTEVPIKLPLPLPPSSGLDMTKYYRYHHSYGHNAEDYWALKDKIEELIQARRKSSDQRLCRPNDRFWSRLALLDLYNQPFDMLGIHPNIICHKLTICPQAKSVSQKKMKMGEERCKTVRKEVDKLLKANFIREVKYSTWNANVVMVKRPMKRHDPRRSWGTFDKEATFLGKTKQRKLKEARQTQDALFVASPKAHQTQGLPLVSLVKTQDRRIPSCFSKILSNLRFALGESHKLVKPKDERAFGPKLVKPKVYPWNTSLQEYQKLKVRPWYKNPRFVLGTKTQGPSLVRIPTKSQGMPLVSSLLGNYNKYSLKSMIPQGKKKHYQTVDKTFNQMQINFLTIDNLI
ncbi:hypothetical protein JHK82_053203 [Glycine max]|nr:hypothetical protein JHK82_053203 [Glycine max]